MKFIKKIFKYKYIIISAILGFICFVGIYGFNVINPVNIDWILSKGGDITQHYLGWEMYRYSPWTFPIGMNTMSVYPNSISVIFTDSIPLFAVIFKLFSNILPNNFQYLGIYGAFCFMLNAITSSIILKKYIKNDFIVILLSMFFILSPAVIYRMYYHTALASHFLIFLAFILILYKDNIKHKTLLWGLLGIICSSIHIYFLLIDGIILLGYMLYELLTTKKMKNIILPFISYIFSSLLTIYLLGGFSLPTTLLGKNSIGSFNFNLNGFFNPFNYSNILEALPTAEYLLQEEGFAYLGFGLIILLFITLICILFKIIYKVIKKQKFNFYKLFLVLLFLIIFSLFISTANSIYYNNILIFKYNIPDSIQNLVGIFRSNGRIIWIAYYIIILICIFITYKCLNKFIYFILICILLCIQIYDFKDWLNWKHYENTYFEYELKLTDERWELLFKEDFNNVILLEDFAFDLDEMYNIDLLVLKYHKRINRFNIAQDLLNDIYEETNYYFTEDVNSENLYIIYPLVYMKYKDLDLNYYELDGLYIASKYEIPYLTKADNSEINLKVKYFADLKLNKEKKYKLIITSEEIIEENDVEVMDYEVNIIDNTISIFVEDKDIVNIILNNDKEINVNIIEF